jgi:peptidoglycan/LPS O-acetylase OafA/YrhL
MGRSGGRLRQLDALRAVAVGGVLFAHFVPAGHPLAALHWLPWGDLGVQLFFVLSGFLITGILLGCQREVDAGRQSVAFSLRQFYVRRCLRIFPAYYLTLGLTSLSLWPIVRETLPWHAGYASNFYLASLGAWRDTVSHLWTLSVEEQFYLLWPLVVLLVPRRRLLRVVIGVVVAAPLFRLATFAAGAPELWRVVLLPSCMDALGLGALLACLEADPARDAARRALARAGLVGPSPSTPSWSSSARRAGALPSTRGSPRGRSRPSPACGPWTAPSAASAGSRAACSTRVRCARWGA